MSRKDKEKMGGATVSFFFVLENKPVNIFVVVQISLYCQKSVFTTSHYSVTSKASDNNTHDKSNSLY